MYQGDAVRLRFSTFRRPPPLHIRNLAFFLTPFLPTTPARASKPIRSRVCVLHARQPSEIVVHCFYYPCPTGEPTKAENDDESCPGSEPGGEQAESQPAGLSAAPECRPNNSSPEISRRCPRLSTSPATAVIVTSLLEGSSNRLCPPYLKFPFHEHPLHCFQGAFSKVSA